MSEYPLTGFFDLPVASGDAQPPFRPGVEGSGHVMPGRPPERSVPSTYPGGGFMDPDYRPMDAGGDPTDPSMDPAQVGRWSMRGLVDRLHFGDRDERVPVPLTSGYDPDLRETRPSITSGDRIHPRTSVSLNLGLYLAPVAAYAQPVPALEARKVANVNQLHQDGRDRRGRHHRGAFGGMLAPPIFPGRVTDWPRAEPRYLTFQGEVVP